MASRSIILNMLARIFILCVILVSPVLGYSQTLKLTNATEQDWGEV